MFGLENHRLSGITYHDTDYGKLVAFLELPNGSVKNGNMINPTGYNPADPNTWTGVNWSPSANGKRVASISWESKNFVGELDLSGCTSLEELYCDSNQLTFSDLPISLPVGGGRYEYSPQAVVPIGTGGEIPAMVELDLSAEANIDGVSTVFTWYQVGGGKIDPAKYEENNGRFIFNESLVGQTIYCTMTNTKFLGLTLTTSQVRVILPPPHSITFIKPTTGQWRN